MSTKKQAEPKDLAVAKQPVTKKTKKAATALTVEQRLERLERDYRLLGAKLRTHGIHLAPETQEDPEQLRDEQLQADSDEEV